MYHNLSWWRKSFESVYSWELYLGNRRTMRVGKREGARLEILRSLISRAIGLSILWYELLGNLGDRRWWRLLRSFCVINLLAYMSIFHLCWVKTCLIYFASLPVVLLRSFLTLSNTLDSEYYYRGYFSAGLLSSKFRGQLLLWLGNPDSWWR